MCGLNWNPQAWCAVPGPKPRWNWGICPIGIKVVYSTGGMLVSAIDPRRRLHPFNSQILGMWRWMEENKVLKRRKQKAPVPFRGRAFCYTKRVGEESMKKRGKASGKFSFRFDGFSIRPDYEKKTEKNASFFQRNYEKNMNVNSAIKTITGGFPKASGY